ncbi:MAG: substrate-binding domain-containing protein [Anaerolineaceae bacterium]|nr:substrate-binding domain-containing protein [Anaerolineaceae bacterium]
MKRNLVTFMVLVMITALVLGGCAQAPEPEATEAPEAAEAAAPVVEEEAAASDETVETDIVFEIPEFYVWPAGDDVTMVDTSSFKIAPPYSIGFSNCSASNAWATLYIETAKWEASKYPEIEELNITDAGDSPEKQLSDIEDLIAKGVDILIIRPCTADAGVPAMEKAQEMGIPVLISNRGSNFDGFVSQQATNMIDLGFNQGTWLSEQLNGEGNIVSMEGTSGSAPQRERYEGAMTVLAGNPGITVVGRVQANWSRDKAKSAMENYLQAGDLAGVLAQAGAMSAGVVEAITEAGLDPCSIPVTGDDYNGYMKMVKENGCGMITTNPTWCGGASIVAAVMTLNGQEVPQNWWLPTKVYTAETIDEVVYMDKSDEFYPNILPDDWEIGN